MNLYAPINIFVNIEIDFGWLLRFACEERYTKLSNKFFLLRPDEIRQKTIFQVKSFLCGNSYKSAEYLWCPLKADLTQMHLDGNWRSYGASCGELSTIFIQFLFALQKRNYPSKLSPLTAGDYLND